jgi:DNA-binding transcriptional MerR regulator
MNTENPRRSSPHDSDVSTPITENTRRISTQDSDAYDVSSGWVTTPVAAKALGVAVRTVQLYVRKGLLKAKAEGEGVNKTYYISIDSVNELRIRRIEEGKLGANTPIDASDDTPHSPAAEFAEVFRDLAARLAHESARAASLETRLELTERAQSSLEEENQALRDETERLRSEVQAERSKGFWRRLFGS